MGFLFGVLVGAIGLCVAGYFIWKNNKKKFVAALVQITQGAGTAEEKVKKIIDYLKSLI